MTIIELKPRGSLSIHKTFAKNDDGKRTVTLFVYDGDKVYKFRDEGLLDFLESFQGNTVRMTSVGSLDSIVKILSDRGVKILFAHWHSTKINKGLSPEEIVKAYHAVDENLFREFKYDADLAELRLTVQRRSALNQFYGDCDRKFQQAYRNAGFGDLKGNAEYEEDIKTLNEIASLFKTPGEKGRIVSYDTRLEQLGKKNDFCLLFNRIAGFKKGMPIAAGLVSVIQDIRRFPQVADLWSYLGMGDAAKQKRKKGQASNWSAEGRRLCYQVGTTIRNNRVEPWRSMYDEEKAKELAKTGMTRGQADARARRKVVKEIVKRFYLAANGIEYQEHGRGAAAGI